MKQESEYRRRKAQSKGGRDGMAERICHRVPQLGLSCGTGEQVGTVGATLWAIAGVQGKRHNITPQFPKILHYGNKNNY